MADDALPQSPRYIFSQRFAPTSGSAKRDRGVASISERRTDVVDNELVGSERRSISSVTLRSESNLYDVVCFFFFCLVL